MATMLDYSRMLQQDRFSRESNLVNSIIRSDATRLRNEAISEERRQREKLRKKAEEGGATGGVLGAIGGAVSGFVTGGPVGALMGAVKGGIGGYQTGRQYPEAGGLLSAAQGLGAGVLEGRAQEDRERKHLQEDVLLGIKQTEAQTKAIKPLLDLKKDEQKFIDTMLGKKEVKDYLTTEAAKQLPDYKVIEKTRDGKKFYFEKKPNDINEGSQLKLNMIQTGRNEYAEVLNDLNAGKISINDIKDASAPISKLSPRLKKLNKKLQFMSEGLARTLSGAVIGDNGKMLGFSGFGGESEYNKFKDMFSVTGRDNADSILYKMGKAIELADKYEQELLYGAEESEKVKLNKIKKITDRPIESSYTKSYLSSIGDIFKSILTDIKKPLIKSKNSNISIDMPQQQQRITSPSYNFQQMSDDELMNPFQ